MPNNRIYLTPKADPLLPYASVH